KPEPRRRRSYASLEERGRAVQRRRGDLRIPLAAEALVDDADGVRDPRGGHAARARPGQRDRPIHLHPLLTRPRTKTGGPGVPVTFGHRLHFTYPALLQARLEHRPECRARIEVINAGVPGYQTRHIRDRLDEDVRPLRPDLLLVLAGWNDLYSDNPASPAKRLDPQSPFNRVLRVSYAAKALTKLAFDLRPPSGEA